MALDPNDPRVLVEWLHYAPASLRGLILRDLLSRLTDVGQDERRALMREAAIAFLPVDDEILKSLLGSGRYSRGGASMTEGVQHLSCDVLMVTVKRTELVAAQIALGIDPDSREDTGYRGIRFWSAEVPSEDGTEPLHVVVTMVGEDSNYEMAAFIHSALLVCPGTRLAILVGMAAGVDEEVDRGDVVAATEVVDYVRGRVTPEGAKKRPRYYRLMQYVGRQVSYFNPGRAGLVERVRRLIDEARSAGHEPWPAGLDDDFMPRFHTGIVMSGDLLLENGSLPLLRESFHDKARAAEMEGVGFAAACEGAGVQWSVFRGIADFGLPIRDDDWQLIATLNAAAAARLFVEQFRFGPSSF